MTAPPGARSVEVPAERLQRWLGGFAERHGAPTVSGDSEQVRLTGGDGARAWLSVPFPPLAPGADPLAALVAHVLLARTVGVLLVRRGGHAAGVFEGARLIASKVDSTYVQGTTKAGGWSQQRFARRRANQSEAAFAAAADVAARVLLPHADRLDALVCGGDRAAVDTALGDRRLAAVRALRTGPLLNIGEPRLRVLQDTPARFRGVRIALDP